MKSLIDLTNALQTYREENEIFNNTLLSFEYTCPRPVLFAEMALASPQALQELLVEAPGAGLRLMQNLSS